MSNLFSEENVIGPPKLEVLPIHFTSYSSLNKLHQCPKKLEIDKLGAGGIQGFKNINFTYGSSVGAGIQELFVSQDYEKAILAAFMAWDMPLCEGLELGDPKKNHKKSFPFVIEAIKSFLPHFNIISQEYELFAFKDVINSGDNDDPTLVPAVELSARVNLPLNFQYRIFIDLVLRHKESGQVVVVELKTDGSKMIQEAKYGNSNQALSYSVILDKIAPGNTSFVVWYIVYYTSLERWEFFDFTKSRLQKANWIRTVLSDTRHIHEYLTSGFFPKHGESCLDFASPCEHYGSCDMSQRALRAGDSVLQERVTKELEETYSFTFNLEDIIQQQLDDIDA